MWEIIGYCCAIIIGILVGLVGAGGSILTVPVLVYLLGIAPVVATGYALFIVGISSLVSTFHYMKRNLVNYRIVLLFGIPSVMAVYLTRKFIVPIIPEDFFSVMGNMITRNNFLMLLLGVLILTSAASMILVKRKYEGDNEEDIVPFIYPRMILIEGIIIGVLTGLVGTGGGFMIVPALVLLCRLPMKTAIGTALLIASAKSSIGFLGEIGNNLNIDYQFLLLFTCFTIVGVFIGVRLSKFISAFVLRKWFGRLLVVAGIYILLREFLTL